MLKGVSSVFSFFKTIVLPILEYGQPAWHLHTRLLSDRLESVQRRATRVILKQRRQEMSYQNIMYNGRHLETVKFNHLRARTNRLHLSAH